MRRISRLDYRRKHNREKGRLMVTLLNIEQGTKPIRFTALGQAKAGVVSTIQPGQPEALQRAIDMVNEFGGPNAWRIEEVTV